MKIRIAAALVCAGAAGLFALHAQQTPSVAASAKRAYMGIKNNFIKAAEKMPEENYSFKPVDAEETFGGRVAHIADSQLGTCTGMTGERKRGAAREKTAKADLVAAIKESFDACDKAFDALTDANALEPVAAGRGQQPRIAALYGLIVHANEVYGSMGVYMRLKGVVPPSSEGR
ncbi:MAG: DinB family protein [Acidobacteriota bacterium]|nr:DinB family protein [Acidobacteriota bacterium]